MAPLAFTSTGLIQESLRRVKAWAKSASPRVEYCGKFSDDMSCIVAERVAFRRNEGEKVARSEKYCAAVKWGIPVVRPDWVKACAASSSAVPAFEDYALKPLEKLKICITGYLGEERDELIELVSRGGGVYNGQLNAVVTTHLVAAKPSGAKYKSAKDWGCIHLVTRQWLRETVARGYCLDETSYPVGLLAQIRAPIDTKAERRSQRHAGKKRKAMESLRAAVISKEEERAKIFRRAQIEDEVNEARSRLADAAATCHAQNDVSLELAGCVMYLAGFERLGASAHADMERIVRTLGGVVLDDFDAVLVTHVVAALSREGLDECHLEIIRRVRDAAPGIYIISPRWVWDSVDEQRIRVDKYFWNESPQLAVDEDAENDVDDDDYVLKQGDFVSVTGYAGKVREDIAKLIKKLGGKFDNRMRDASSRMPTACLIAKPDVLVPSEKVVTARKWGLPIRDHNWLRGVAEKRNEN